MSTHLSLFGLFHTAVSVLPIGFGLVALFRDGKIEPRNWTGKLYLATMLIGSVTAFGLSKSGGFNFGHVLSAMTLGLLLVGTSASRINLLGRLKPYVETLSLSASFLLLMVFATTETLTRLPASQPIAAGPDAPILETIRLGLLMTFLAGSAYQVWRIRETHAHRIHLAALEIYVTRVA